MDYAPDWSIRLSYTYSYSKVSKTPTKTNSLTLSGSLAFSQKWKMEMSTGYDFEASQITDLRFNFARSLGTWNMTLTWAPSRITPTTVSSSAYRLRCCAT